ncbi:MAG TPA: hypothetical protein VGE98_09390, partial [Thermoanaerobaculia bacterium]
MRRSDTRFRIRSLPCLVTLVAASTLLVSCSSTHKTPPRANLLMADERGRPLDPAPPYKRLQVEQLDAAIDHVFESLSAYCADKKPCKILWFFHGGLNSHGDSVDRAAKLSQRICHDGSFPIFFSWDSSLAASWWDHVAHIHSGFWTGSTTDFLAPYFVAVDEVKGVAQAPLAWWSELRHTFLGSLGYRIDRNVLASYHELVLPEDAERAISVNELPGDRSNLYDDRSLSEKVLPGAVLPLTLATKIMLPPLVIQGPGSGAWDVMRRRTAVLFRTEDEMRGIPREVVEQRREKERDRRLAESRTSRGEGESAAPEPAQTDTDTIAALRYFTDRYQNDFLPQFCATHHYYATPTADRGGPAQQKIDRRRGPTEPVQDCPEELDLTLV